jgi:hypothetical protein
MVMGKSTKAQHLREKMRTASTELLRHYSSKKVRTKGFADVCPHAMREI